MQITIETKFNIGDEIYTIYNNGIHKVKIVDANILTSGMSSIPSSCVKYICAIWGYQLGSDEPSKYHNVKWEFYESDLYKTREEIPTSNFEIK